MTSFPLIYRCWSIRIAPDDCHRNYEFSHRDYCEDNDSDPRYGWADTIEDAKREIDSLEAEFAA